MTGHDSNTGTGIRKEVFRLLAQEASLTSARVLMRGCMRCAHLTFTWRRRPARKTGTRLLCPLPRSGGAGPGYKDRADTL